MKKFLLFVLLTMTSALMTRAENIGVPAECEDVMLQAFYWDSYKTQTATDSKYGRTKWIDLLKDTAAINANFDLVWFPPSASSTGGVGYYHACLSNQDGAWGTRAKLTQLINALHAGNTKVLADIVINHRGNKSTWVDFWQDNFGTYGTYQLTQSHICSGDEAFTDPSSSYYGSTTHGGTDTGTNDGGCRDLDHRSEFVQSWAKAYVQWMLNVMHYDGFRYDMTRGYHGSYLSMYNQTAQPYFSVSEYWEGIDKQVNHLRATNFNTLVFDFPMKYVLCNAIRYSSYSQLVNPSNSLRNRGYRRYAVSFIDNHDTFERADAQSQEFLGYNVDLSTATVKNKILQANAYILMLPGVPCVFYPHWKSYQEEINAIIALRKKAGIHSESDVYESVNNNSYEVITYGHRGTLILRLGPNRSRQAPDGYYVALEGGTNGEYTIFAANGTAVDEVETEPTDKCVKFVRDGRMLIRRGNQVFDMTGRIVE